MILIAVAIFSGTGFLARMYIRITIPAPQVGRTYTEGMLREPRFINPVYAATDGDRDIAKLIFSSLFVYNGKGELEMDLAESYELSKDGKTYTVVLKKDAYWHDGEPVMADDVLFTVKMIQNPQFKSPLRANWQGVTAERIDDHAIRFTLRSSYAPFIENLSIGIIPKHLWKDIGPEQALLHELNLKPLGSGPYKFDSLEQKKDGTIVWYSVRRNRDYYGEGPYLKNIKFYFFEAEEEILAAWQRDRIEGFGPFPAHRLREFNLDRSLVVPVAMPRLFGMFFNEKQSTILADKQVRRAIAHALNKEEIASHVSSTGASAIDTLLPFWPSGPQAVTAYTFDPQKSREILEKAGWKDSDGDGLREKRTGQKGKEKITPLQFKLTTSDWPDLLRTADAIRDSLKEIGVAVAIEKHSFTDLESSVIRPRNFEILLFGQVYGYEPDPFAFWHSSQIKDPGLNIAMYSNKKADQLLEESRRTPDRTLRAQKYEALQKIIEQDIPAIFLYSQLYHYVLPANMKGTDIKKISLPADRFNEINKWYRETKRVLK